MENFLEINSYKTAAPQSDYDFHKSRHCIINLSSLETFE